MRSPRARGPGQPEGAPLVCWALEPRILRGACRDVPDLAWEADIDNVHVSAEAWPFAVVETDLRGRECDRLPRLDGHAVDRASVRIEARRQVEGYRGAVAGVEGRDRFRVWRADGAGKTRPEESIDLGSATRFSSAGESTVDGLSDCAGLKHRQWQSHAPDDLELNFAFGSCGVTWVGAEVEVDPEAVVVEVASHDEAVSAVISRPTDNPERLRKVVWAFAGQRAQPSCCTSPGVLHEDHRGHAKLFDGAAIPGTNRRAELRGRGELAWRRSRHDESGLPDSQGPSQASFSRHEVGRIPWIRSGGDSCPPLRFPLHPTFYIGGNRLVTQDNVTASCRGGRSGSTSPGLAR